MKKILSLLVVAVLMLGMMSVSVSATRDLVYTAQYGVATVDGVMEDAWLVSGSKWTQIDLPYSANGAVSVCSARALVMHDDALLYFLVEVTDATLGDGNGDAFEIYFDEDSCADVAYCDVTTQLAMNLNGDVVKGANSLGDIDMVKEYVVGKSDNGYVLEFSVELMNGIPAAGSTIGLEFMYNDCDEAGTFLDALRWNVDTANGDTAPWQAPECFGKLECAEYVAPAEPEVPAEDAPAADVSTPVTADAGIVVAAVVMAAAAAVVCKKH